MFFGEGGGRLDVIFGELALLRALWYEVKCLCVCGLEGSRVSWTGNGVHGRRVGHLLLACGELSSYTVD